MKTVKRRNFLKIFASIGIFGTMAGQTAYALVKSFFPKARYEPPQRFKVGSAYQFTDGPNFLAKHRIFVIKEGNKFHALSSVCTHLGCNVTFNKLAKTKNVTVRGKEIEEKWEFNCACHGSKFYGDGTPYTGPAPTPLPAYEVSVSAVDRKLIVDKNIVVDSGQRFTV
ncbi:MAG: ubiquinol-cytochrome c reductase iron-sulfur subunit [Deltaproteobacteria bacterium]|nr:MAG: ubiquinol-cytochrome c reductase iron-sulfur subunit [Deltaproteobacteria bacterium]